MCSIVDVFLLRPVLYDFANSQDMYNTHFCERLFSDTLNLILNNIKITPLIRLQMSEYPSKLQSLSLRKNYHPFRLMRLLVRREAILPFSPKLNSISPQSSVKREKLSLGYNVRK